MFLLILLIIFVWKFVYPLARILFLYTVGKTFWSHRGRLRQAGEWAIVTGGSEGIGRAYACELAKEGLNIFILGNNTEKLLDTAKSIKQQFHVNVKTLTVDFTRDDIYTRIESELDQLSSIACLVNNVGMFFSTIPVASPETSLISLDFIRNIIYCNMVSTAAMTRLVARKMLIQAPNGAAIINLSSISATFSWAYFPLYAASKAFILLFTEALQREFYDTSLVIQAVCPCLVATALSWVEQTSFFVPDAQTYAKSALDMLGVESVTNGFFRHALQAEIIKYVSDKSRKARSYAAFQKHYGCKSIT